MYIKPDEKHTKVVYYKKARAPLNLPASHPPCRKIMLNIEVIHKSGSHQLSLLSSTFLIYLHSPSSVPLRTEGIIGKKKVLHISSTSPCLHTLWGTRNYDTAAGRDRDPHTHEEKVPHRLEGTTGKIPLLPHSI